MNFFALTLKNFRKRKPREKFLLFQETETLLIFREMALFTPPRESLLYFRKRKPLKNFLYFLKRKLFLYFGKRKPRKNSLYFGKRKRLKTYFSGSNFPFLKNEKNSLLKYSLTNISYASGNETF